MVDKSQYTKLDNGSYKSNAFGSPEDIYTDNYWSHDKGHSTIDEQIANVVEKNELVKVFITDIEPKAVLEIACAPGILLKQLSEKFVTFGIEVDNSYKSDLERISPTSWFLFGFFPKVTEDIIEGLFSNIIALDVIEHVEDGNAFLKECNRLLVKDGRLIIQAPMTLYDGVEPDAMFHVQEHIWIYHIKHLTELLEQNGFYVIEFTRWKVGHEQVVAVKK